MNFELLDVTIGGDDDKGENGNEEKQKMHVELW
jgi:hypothetical protein